jgi:hypothetical protein
MGVGESSARESPELGFAAFAGGDWELPTAVQDLLSLKVYWSSGRVNDGIAPYFPVSGIGVGEIFSPRLSAMMYLKAAYRLRPYKTVNAEAGAGYFIRTDLQTLQDGELTPPDTGLASESRLLGGEIYGSLGWTPQSALGFNARGGVFFPGWGGAFESGTKPRWNVSVGAFVSF